MLYKSLLVILIWQITLVPQVICQLGFKKVIGIESAEKFTVNGLKFHNNQLYLQGSIFIDSLGLWGGYLAQCDTTGELLNIHIFNDPEEESHLSHLIQSKIAILPDNRVIIPIKVHGQNLAGICIIDTESNTYEILSYSMNDFAIFPKIVLQSNSNIFIIGYVQRYNYFLDNFVIKIDYKGKLEWIKYYGSDNFHEYIGDAIVNSDNSITISSCITTEEFGLNQLVSWKKPWVFSINENGDIIDNWIGAENDTKSLGGGPLCKIPGNTIILGSEEYKKIFVQGVELIGTNPTITSLDSVMDLNWKHYLGDFGSHKDGINNIVFDSTNNELILAGEKLIYDATGKGRFEFWLIKINSDGVIHWNISDTLQLDPDHKYFYQTTALDIMPSRSIFAAVSIYDDPSIYKGFIVKIMPDGCIDTMCITTSIDLPQTQEMKINIFPNPARDYVNIKSYSKFKLFSYKIMDLNGKEYKTGIISDDINKVELNLSPGLYVCSFFHQNKFLYSIQVIIN